MKVLFPIVTSLVAAAIAVVVAPAAAHAHRTKPVKLIVPSPPGDSLDFAGRLIAHKN